MNEDGQLTDWLKWITGGIIAGMALFWQWMERKVDRLNDRIDTLRENVRKDRHDLADSMHENVKSIDEDIDDLKDRVAKVERDPK